MRFAPINTVAGKLINFFLADDIQKHQIGSRFEMVSYDYSQVANVGNGLGGTAVYSRAAGNFATGRLVHTDKDGQILDMPVTAGTGRPISVCMSSFNALSPFGWTCRAGVVPVAFGVAATAGAVFGGAAGVASPTPAAGRQILNAVTLIGSAGSFTRATRTVNASPFVIVNDAGGLYPGLTISGTGLPGATTIASMRFFDFSATAACARA